MDKQGHGERPTDAHDIIARLQVEVDDIIDLIRRPAKPSRVEADDGAPQRRCEKPFAGPDQPS